MDLKGRTAIVTGASMGIGAATALQLADAGATVWAIARNRERLEQVIGKRSSIHPLVGDLTTQDDRSRLLRAVVGDVDILVNNAGVATSRSIASTSMDDVRHMYELNVLALIELTKGVLPRMLERGTGHICNVGSSASYYAGPPLSIYASTKFAVQGFTDGLRREVTEHGIRVSLLQPGPVRTGFWDRAASGDRPDVDSTSGAGLSAEHVAMAIVRAIRRDRLPGYRTVAVPRALGLGRALDLPGLGLAVDMIASRVDRPRRISRGR
jgi:short-subunit dehydrogenase